MQNQTQDFAKIFLIEFTRQLILKSQPRKTIEITQKEKIPHPQEIQELNKVQKITRQKKPIKKLPLPITKTHVIPQTPQIQQNKIAQSQNKKQQLPVLTIPEQRLPPQFQNIIPTATERKIDLEKLNQIIENPAVISIECEGPNTPIIQIDRTGQKKPTQITLTKEEIDNIINTFSTLTKIPALEGVYKVAAGNLILLSTISEVIGTKFVIRKIPKLPPQQTMQPRSIGMPARRQSIQAIKQRFSQPNIPTQKPAVPSKRILMPPK